jgi:NAD+ diphosphatase
VLAHDCRLPEGQSVFLGLQNDKPQFAVDVSSLDDTAADLLAQQARTRSGLRLAGEFAELRVAGPMLSAEDGSLLAYARALIYWNGNTRHCLRCGHLLASRNAGHARQCTNEPCGYLVFPRTDPAVIMLVSHTPADGSEPLCLLGRNPAWPAGVFSTLAGFVEPGESLESAVRREVLEEAAIHTSEVRYIASQPWPFPRSIMLGFEATATSTDITCDPTELADARWFTRDQLARFGNWGDESDNFKLPRKDSIARFLIDRWMAQRPSLEG